MHRSLQNKTWNIILIIRLYRRKGLVTRLSEKKYRMKCQKAKPPTEHRILTFNKQRPLFYKNTLDVFYMYKFRPHHIVSVNESGFSDVRVSPPIIIPKGQKNIKIATIFRKVKACDVLWAPVDCWYHSYSTTTDSWRSPWNYLFAQNQDGWRKAWLSWDSNI